MNPIELGKAIAEIGIPVITGIMLILVVGLVWYLIRRQTKREDKHDVIQKDERDFYRKLVTNDMKELHEDNVLTAEVTNKSIVLLKGIGDSQKRLCTLIGNVDKRINGKK